jgi:hypothetical protein
MADRYEAMFLAAVQSLAEISKALDIPDDEAACANGNELVLEAIEDLGEWRTALLDELGSCAMDAPQDEAPASILKRVIAWHVQAASGVAPSLNHDNKPVTGA